MEGKGRRFVFTGQRTCPLKEIEPLEKKKKVGGYRALKHVEYNNNSQLSYCPIKFSILFSHHFTMDMEMLVDICAIDTSGRKMPNNMCRWRVEDADTDFKNGHRHFFQLKKRKTLDMGILFSTQNFEGILSIRYYTDFGRNNFIRQQLYPVYIKIKNGVLQLINDDRVFFPLLFKVHEHNELMNVAGTFLSSNEEDELSHLQFNFEDTMDNLTTNETLESVILGDDI